MISQLYLKASSKEVKAAFYRLSKLHHPDSNIADASALARFQKLGGGGGGDGGCHCSSSVPDNDDTLSGASSHSFLGPLVC